MCAGILYDDVRGPPQKGEAYPRMKKKLFCLALAGIVSLTACSSVQQNAAEEEKFPRRVSAVLPHTDQSYWTDLANGMREEAEARGIDLKVSIPQLNYNVDQMTSLVRQQTAAQVDALLVQGIDDPDYRAALWEAYEAGIEVMLVDTNDAQLFDHVYVGTDNYEAGCTLGRALLEISGGQAVVMIMSGEPNYLNLDERIRGLKETVAGYDGIRIVGVEYDKYDSLTVLDRYQAILQEHPEVDTLVGVEGTSCMALGLALDPENAPLTILGFDRDEESEQGMANGVIAGVVTQDSTGIGKKAIEVLADYFETGTHTQWEYYTPAEFCSREDYLQEVADYE